MAKIARKRQSPANRLCIIVMGYLIRGPVGGMAWHHLQYVVGLDRVGYDVYFLEDSEDYPACYDPSRDLTDTDPSYGLAFAQRTFKRLGLGERWAYHDAHTSRWHGPCSDRIFKICSKADLLLNLSGANPLRRWFEEVPVRALIDTDPAFTQIRHLKDSASWSEASKHTAFLTFGENITMDSSAIPDDGLPWETTRQPILLDIWPFVPAPSQGKYTTVMLWDSYPAVEYNGLCYGMKSDSFKPYLDLPVSAGNIFELAVGSPSAPKDLLRSKGWLLCNPLEVARDPWTYQRYIQRSKAEFSVAKHGYAVSRSGWFSERSAAYLASGRPVVTQDTGFSEWLQTGSGVFPFSSLGEALAGIEDINSRYDFHCRAARAIAEEYFDARKVLPRLIECAMNSAQNPAV